MSKEQRPEVPKMFYMAAYHVSELAHYPRNIQGVAFRAKSDHSKDRCNQLLKRSINFNDSDDMTFTGLCTKRLYDFLQEYELKYPRIEVVKNDWLLDLPTLEDLEPSKDLPKFEQEAKMRSNAKNIGLLKEFLAKEARKEIAFEASNKITYMAAFRLAGMKPYKQTIIGIAFKAGGNYDDAECLRLLKEEINFDGNSMMAFGLCTKGVYDYLQENDVTPIIVRSQDGLLDLVTNDDALCEMVSWASDLAKDSLKEDDEQNRFSLIEWLKDIGDRIKGAFKVLAGVSYARSYDDDE